jgi:hypothetical protein
LDRYFFEIIFEVVELIGHSNEFSGQGRALDRHAGEVVIQRTGMKIECGAMDLDGDGV